MSNNKIDVSTHQLAELTQRALGGKIPLDEVLAVWHEIGQVIRSQLLQRKAVRMTSFGTFTFSKGDPVFLLANEFSSQFKIKQKGQPTPDNVPTASLNFSQVKAALKTPRDVVEKIYSKYLTCLGRSIFEGRSVLLTIYKVAEINITNNEIVYNFISDFSNMFNHKDIKVGSNSMDQIRKVSQKTTQNILQQNDILDHYGDDLISSEMTGLNIGQPEQPKPNKGRAISRGRDRNPITGEFGSEFSSSTVNRRPVSAGRNNERNPQNFRRPNSAGTNRSGLSNPSMMSPGINSPYVNQANSSRGGLTKNELERHNQTYSAGKGRPNTPTKNQQYVDPRKLAAKALNTGDIIDKVRSKIVQRGGSNGIRSITKLLSIMDNNGDKRLSKEELRYGLRDYGVDLTPTELEQVFLYFDRDGNGFIDVTEFLVGLKGDLTPRRKSIVRMAFNLLDKDCSGVISTDEILQCFDLNWHPEVRAGRMSVKEAAKDFMAQWDRKDKDGNVTLEEFEEYYKEISASIDDDDYFELMIRNAWRIAGGEGMAANTANKRVLVTNRDGSQSVQTIQQELGMKGRDKDDIRNRLARQGVQAETIDLHGSYEDMKNPSKGRTNPLESSTRKQIPLAKSSAVRSNSAPRPAARKEAWTEFAPPQGGDQSLPSEFENHPQYNSRQSPRISSSSNQYSNSNKFDTFEILKKLLYNPPIPLEALCIKLQISSVNTSPRMAQGAFLKRLSTLDPTLTRSELNLIWKDIDPKNIGSIEATVLHNLLSNRFGKDKTSSKGSSVIDRVKIKILERCGETAGIKGLSRTLAIMDNSGDKKLSKEELKFGLQDYGIELNIREIDELFIVFDRDHNGFIDVDEFLIGVRGEMNERRTRMVDMVFNILDTDGSGIISLDEMLEKFDFSKAPEVIAGKKTIKEAVREFVKQWDRADGDGNVTRDEFHDYYKGISASIDGDDYFELMIRNAWRIAGGEGMAANTANKRVLVTNRDGSQSVQTIQQELGMKGRDKDDIRNRLARQGVQAETIDLHGSYEDMKNPSNGKTSTIPRGVLDRSSANKGNERLNKTAPAQAQQASGFERNLAAAKLAAAYRGRLGRKKADQEKRKVEATNLAKYEEEIEANRPRPRELIRPKGKSYIGF